MSSNSRLDTTIALKITKILPTYLTNFVQYPGASIISFMEGQDAPFGDKTTVDGIRHPEEEITVSSEIEYNFKYARKYARRMDMPSITDAIMIKEEDYAGDIPNAMGHIADLGANFAEGINLFAFEGSLKPLMYGISDYPNATDGSRERPELCAPVTAAGKWDVASSIPPTLADMEMTLTSKRFYGPKIVLAHPIVKPMLSNILTNTATPVGTWMTSAYGYPIIFSPWVDADSTVNASDVYMIDASKFAYTMTPVRIKTYFDDPTDDWVWKWQTRFVLRPKPLYDGSEWLKGAVYSTVDCTT
jgi:hypothetical protein